MEQLASKQLLLLREDDPIVKDFRGADRKARSLGWQKRCEQKTAYGFKRSRRAS